MIRRILSFLTFGALGASSSSVAQDKEEIDIRDLDPAMQDLVRDIAGKQAAGLDDAEVIVHSVTERTEFYRATPQDNEKLIVVDVTFKNHKLGFGLAGVELIDGRAQKARSYGGGAYQVYLKEDGTLMEDQSGEHLIGPITWKNEDPIRVFLVYSAPKDLDQIGLGYWGKIIVDRPYKVVPAPNIKEAESGR
ncbi:hypothetical protein [Luteolibacter marinus]|uniref:hypothetical protein n=1 Tax=Luteolibacter marinus TaxID=2776705 RepID=UPI0018677423|nr:hypothetical protein [Luteolibacter marinus]